MIFIMKHIFISTFFACMLLSLTFSEITWHLLYNNGGEFYIHLIISIVVSLVVLMIDRDELESYAISYIHDHKS